MTKKSNKDRTVSTLENRSYPWQGIVARWIRRSVTASALGASLAFSTSVFAADWVYNPNSPITGGTYENIVQFDGGDTLKMNVGYDSYAYFGGTGVPFKIFDKDNAEVDRSSILNVEITATENYSKLYFGTDGVNESWTVQDNGSFLSNMTGSSSRFTIGGSDGTGAFTVGTAGGANNAIVIFNNRFNIGADYGGGAGTLTLNGGTSSFSKEVYIGGNGDYGGSDAGGNGLLNITGGTNRFGDSLEIGGYGSYDDGGSGGGDGGSGTMSISGGTNYFEDIQFGGSGGGGGTTPPRNGGNGTLDITGGTNVFSSYIDLGGREGKNASEVRGISGTGTLNINGGNTLFQDTISLGDGTQYYDVVGSDGALNVSSGMVTFRKADFSGYYTYGRVYVGGEGEFTNGRGEITITGGTMVLDNFNVTVRNGGSNDGKFDLQSGGTLKVVANSTDTSSTISVRDLSLNGTLAFDLANASSTVNVLDFSDVTSFAGSGKVDITAFGAAGTYTLATTDVGDFSTIAGNALTVNGQAIAGTRASGSTLTTGNGDKDLVLTLGANAAAKKLYWNAPLVGQTWNVTSYNFNANPTPSSSGNERYLPGDTIHFSDEFVNGGFNQNIAVAIADYGVAVKDMYVERGDWTFTGGEIDGQITLLRGSSVYFDSRTFKQTIVLDGTKGDDYGAQKGVAPKDNGTITFSGLETGIQLHQAKLSLGLAPQGTVNFMNNDVAIRETSNGGEAQLTAGISNFSNNKTAAVKASVIKIQNGTHTFVNNGNATDGKGAFHATYNNTWNAYVGGTSGTVQISGGTNKFLSNTSASSGGAIYGYDSVTISAGTNTFQNNIAGTYGGAISAEGHAASKLTISGGTNTFTGNSAAADGGAISVAGDLLISGGTNTFQNNSSGDKGGAIYANANATIVAKDGDMTFKGNTDSDGANAIYIANDSGGKQINIGAAADKTVFFYDPIETEDTDGDAVINIGMGEGDALLAGTVHFDKQKSNVYAETNLQSGTMKMTGGAVYGVDNSGNASFNLLGSATLLADAGKNKISADEISFANGSTIKADMTDAVNQVGATPTTNLVLYANTFTIGAGDKFNVDAVNVTGLSGTYLLIDASGFTFTGNYNGKVNGEAVGSGPGGGKINDRYGDTLFDDSNSGKLYLTLGTNTDDARIATWDGSVNNTWSEMNADANWVLQGNATQKMFKNSDWVEFNNSSSIDNTITVSATGTSTSVVVQGMTVSGANNWTFTGSGITGTAVAPATSADFVMNGTGIVKFENDTKFTNYKVNSGTLQTATGKKLDGAVQLAASSKLTAGYGTQITGQLGLANGNTITVDMTGATTTGSGLKAASIALASGTITVDVTGFSGTDSSYTIIEDASAAFNFTSQFTGKINGQTPPINGTPNVRYGSLNFNTATLGKLILVNSGSDSVRTATWDGGSGTWDEVSTKWTLSGSAVKYFKNSDDVVFGGTEGQDRAIAIDAYGSATSVGVKDMTVSGSNKWAFSGDDITGTGDFIMNGTGSVKFENETAFTNYKINTGTLKTVDGGDLTGNVSVAGPATLEAEYGSVIVGALAVTDGSTLKIDMTGASTSETALDVSSMSKTGTGKFKIDLTGVGAINGSYDVIDASGFTFTDTFTGTINGQAAPIVTPPNERYGKTDFNTATAGKLSVDVTGADIARTATYKGTNGAWNETSQNWNLDGGSTSNYFKAGDQVAFDGATGQTVTVNPTSPATSMQVSGMTVSGGSEWTFTGNKILGQALTAPSFGDGKLKITGTGTKAIFQNEIDFKGGIEIANGNNLVFDYDSATPIKNDNTISGDGAVEKDGSGELKLTAANTYSGGTTVSGGTLTAENENAFGTAAVMTTGTGLLKLDFDGTFNNDILGTGNIEAAGDHVVINKTTNVNMEVTGFLGGDATYNSLVVKSGGTLSPGNSPGKITSSNGATFENGSTYEYEIDMTDRNNPLHDELVVSDGNVDIKSGAQLEVKFLNGSTAEVNDRFQVIEAAQSRFVDDTLFTLIGTWQRGFDQSIEADGYWITAVQRAPEFANAVRGYATPNAYRSAVGMDSIYDLGFESNIQTLYDALANMPDNDPAGLAAAFQQLHGEAYASSREAASLLQRHFVRNLPSALDRIAKSGCSPCDAVCSPSSKLNLWGTFTGDWINRHNIGSYSGYKLNTAGVMVGADRSVGKRGFAGIAFGYDNATQNFKTLSAKNEMDVFRVMGYGGLRRGNWYVDGYVGYTNDRHEMKRDIAFADFSGKARAKFNDDMFSTGFEIGRKMNFGKTLVTPSFGVHYVYLDSPSVTETGAGDANLYISGGKFDSLRMPLGVKISRDFKGQRIVWTPEARAFYVAELGDDSASVRSAFNNVRNIGFTASSGKWGRSSGVFGLGLKGQLSDRLHVRADYDHEVYEHTDMGEASVSVGLNW